ncbi:MAG: anaerobic ribonucleoside-triphosphate reductase activating protein [Clostridia bacterium]|nr:anaerobic ribonucleoside-triphosphate reductase activating protein [Clostridia bacterium]
MENKEDNTLRISGIVKESTVDGPGFRYVVFTQGCPHHCKGCHNPQTHSYNGGNITNISDIVEDIKKNPLLKGVTISGGEPFIQAKQVAKLLSQINREKLSTIVYTGYLFEDLLKDANEENGYQELLNQTDILIDGKFEEELMNEHLLFRGSSNQRSIKCKESMESGNVILHEF